jgi:NitT/TauT family transport system permease protein
VNAVASSVRAAVVPLCGLLGFFALWELGVAVFDIPAYQLPSPWRIVHHIVSENGFYRRQGWTTIWHALLSLAVALVIAIPLAALMAEWRLLDQLVQPVAVLLQVTPIVAYAPAITIWVGRGARTVVTVAVIVCAIPILLALVSGLRAADRAALDVLRTVRASRFEIFRLVRFPGALPSLFAGLRIAVGLALIGVVLGEFFALPTVGQGGLGEAIKSAQARPNQRIDLDWVFNDQLWGSIFVLALIGTVGLSLVSVLEKRLLPWHSSVTE